jgi:hypothetical protein
MLPVRNVSLIHLSSFMHCNTCPIREYIHKKHSEHSSLWGSQTRRWQSYIIVCSHMEKTPKHFKSSYDFCMHICTFTPLYTLATGSGGHQIQIWIWFLRQFREDNTEDYESLTTLRDQTSTPSFLGNEVCATPTVHLLLISRLAYMERHLHVPYTNLSRSS